MSPISPPVPLLLPPLVTMRLYLYLWVYFCFVSKFFCVIFSDSTYNWCYMIFVLLHVRQISDLAHSMSRSICVCVCAQLLHHARLFATPWTIAWQAPLSMGFSRQEYRNGLPCPPSGDLPDPGIKPGCPALQVDTLLLSHWGSPYVHPCCCTWHYFILFYGWLYIYIYIYIYGVYMYTPHLLYPFTFQWTFSLLPHLGCCK